MLLGVWPVVGGVRASGAVVTQGATPWRTGKGWRAAPARLAPLLRLVPALVPASAPGVALLQVPWTFPTCCLWVQVAGRRLCGHLLPGLARVQALQPLPSPRTVWQLVPQTCSAP